MSATKQSKKTSSNGKPALGESLFALRPGPVDATPDRVRHYVDALRAASAEGAGDPLVIRAEAWEQLELLHDLFGQDPDATAVALAQIYADSSAPETIPAGLFRGQVVAPIGRGIEGRALRAVTNVYLPWIGKRFDDEPGGGINVVRRSIRLAIRLIWPSYSPQPMGPAHIGIMRFKTSIEPSVVDDGKQVLRLDYNLPENPNFPIRKTLDELVEVVPGTLLGKMTALRGGRYMQLAYFALRQDRP